MSVSHSPQIVRNGLILHLDAANSRSYPGTGITWTDLTVNTNNGTLINTPTYNSSNNGYFTFDGSSNYINIPTSSNITFSSGSSYSLSAWFYISSLPGTWTGIITKSRDLTPWYGLWISSGNQYDWATPGNGGIINLLGSVAKTGWHNLCGVYNTSSNLSTLYVDGISNTSTSITSYAAAGSGDLAIGWAKGTGEYLNGSVSNVCMYNRALSDTEVLKNYNALKGRYGL